MADPQIEAGRVCALDSRVMLVVFMISTAFMVVAVGSIIYFSSERYRHSGLQGYVGPDRCSECHEEQAAAWVETRMARSFEALRRGACIKEKELAGLDPDTDYTHDEECLPCHTTGYGKVGGFVSIEETPEMAGVTCEACHGAGGRYVGTVMDTDEPTFDTRDAQEAGLIYPPTARVCRQCHNEDSPFVDLAYVFDYDERVSSGTHHHFALKYEHNR